MALDDRQDRFCREYVIDLNGTQAAIRAGYSKRTAAAQAARLLTNVNINQRIDELKAERNNRLEINADSTVQEIANLAHANIQDYLEAHTERVLVGYDPETNEPISEIQSVIILKDTRELTREQAAAIESVKMGKYGLEFKLVDKSKNLELLGRHQGIFKDNLNITVTKKLEDFM